jgi:hypothetical protein
MSGHDGHDRLLEAATAAALKVLDDATDDDAAEALWRRLCCDVFTYQLASGDTATADAFAAMANEKLHREGCRFVWCGCRPLAPARCGPVDRTAVRRSPHRHSGPRSRSAATTATHDGSARRQPDRGGRTGVACVTDSMCGSGRRDGVNERHGVAGGCHPALRGGGTRLADGRTVASQHSVARQAEGRCREDKGRVVGRPVGGSVGQPVVGCWPRLLAFRRGSASRCSGSPLRGGRIRRARSPVIGALGAANHPFLSAASSVDSSPLGAKRGAVAHDAIDNAAGGARNLAFRADTGTSDHRAINTTVLDRSDAVSIIGRATHNAAKPLDTAWPDCWRAVSDADHALNFAGRASPGRGPICPITAADACGSRYVRCQPPAGPRSTPSPGLLPRSCGRDLRAADARIYPPLPAGHRDHADRVSHSGRGQPSGHNSINLSPELWLRFLGMATKRAGARVSRAASMLNEAYTSGRRREMPRRVLLAPHAPRWLQWHRRQGRAADRRQGRVRRAGAAHFLMARRDGHPAALTATEGRHFDHG